MVGFTKMMGDHAGESLIVHGAEVLIGTFFADELLVVQAGVKGNGAILKRVVWHFAQVFIGFQHGIIDEEFSLVGRIVQVVKEFGDVVEVQGVILGFEIEDVEDIGVCRGQEVFSCFVVFFFAQDGEDVDVIIKIRIIGFDVLD